MPTFCFHICAYRFRPTPIWEDRRIYPTNISEYRSPPPSPQRTCCRRCSCWFCSHKYDFYCGALAAFCLYSDRSLTRNYLRRFFLAQNKIDKFPMRFRCCCCILLLLLLLLLLFRFLCLLCFHNFALAFGFIWIWIFTSTYIYICIYIICVRLGDFNIYRLSDLQQEFAKNFPRHNKIKSRCL